MQWAGRAFAAVSRAFPPPVILALGWAAFLVYAYPGFMSYDSVWQLIQGRGMEPLNDWHPPLMALVWRYADKIWSGPFLMLAIQSITFTVSSYVVAKQVMRPRFAALVAVFLLLVPMNIVVMAVIWKDSQMAGFLMTAIALLLVRSRRANIAALVFLFLATGFRWNAAAATLPILFLLWNREANLSLVRRSAIAVGLWLGVTIAALGVNSLLTQRKTGPWASSVAVSDIIGTLRYAHHITNEDVARETAGVPWIYQDKLLNRVHSTYRARNTWIEETQSPGALIQPNPTPEQQRAIGAAWRKLVFAHPLAYLHHRANVFHVMLKSEPQVWSGFVDSAWAEDALHYHREYRDSQRSLIKLMELSVKTPFFYVWLYLLLAVVLLPFARRNATVATLFASGILYELGFFVATPAPDYRYSHWLIVSTILGIVLLVVERVKARA